MAFFKGHDDTWCDLPLVATLTFNDDAEQYRVAIVLRRPLLRRLRRAVPSAPLHVRVDGGFAGTDWLDVLEAEQVEYGGGLAPPRLEPRASRLLGEAYGLSKDSGRTEHVYGETLYAAQRWSHRRRVRIKAEGVRLPGRDPKYHPRCVGTKLTADPATGYAVSGQRGDTENRLKEWREGLAMDRTSGSRFLGQSVLRAAHGRSRRAGAGVAAAGRRDRRCPYAGGHVARAPAHAGGMGGKRSGRRIVLPLPRSAP